MITKQWDDALSHILNSKEFNDFSKFVDSEYENYILYPPKEDIYKALKLTDFEDVKVVILGQDPYHQKNQANGLAFSVNADVKIPRSLVNIFKELKSDLGIDFKNGDLSRWAKNGVLLLNTSLMVRESNANFYKNSYWKYFTNEIIKALNRRENIVYILWGNEAQKKENLIDSKKNLIIKSVHPSPLSASKGFFGSKPFSKANDYLLNNNISQIDWRLYDWNNFWRRKRY